MIASHREATTNPYFCFQWKDGTHFLHVAVCTIHNACQKVSVGLKQAAAKELGIQCKIPFINFHRSIWATLKVFLDLVIPNQYHEAPRRGWLYFARKDWTFMIPNIQYYHTLWLSWQWSVFTFQTIIDGCSTILFFFTLATFVTEVLWLHDLDGHLLWIWSEKDVSTHLVYLHMHIAK